MKLKLSTLLLIISSPLVIANENNSAQDMSDPLAVYTQAGIGATNKGLNLKIGHAYDTGSADSLGMNIIEIKGFAGASLGWDYNHQRDEAIDELRFRNFHVNSSSGIGQQVDLNWNIDDEVGYASYSLIKALPATGAVQLYPLAGVGLSVAEDRDNQSGSGYIIPGSFGVVGMYSKLSLTDHIWLNYNPMYMKSLGGHEQYRYSSTFNHELAASYQINANQNLRTFVNWTDDTRFAKGDFRIEFNHQF